METLFISQTNFLVNIPDQSLSIKVTRCFDDGVRALKIERHKKYRRFTKNMRNAEMTKVCGASFQIKRWIFQHCKLEMRKG